jgi:hypothetical protein
MRAEPLKINSIAGMAVAIFLVPLMIACMVMYAIQGPDPEDRREAHIR